MAINDWEPVIGLEIHAQLSTHSKLFCADSASFGSGDNENVSPVSLGLPGSLPVLNKTVLEFSAKVGLALNCHVREKSVFARKNYFYPDLPKGYQISQFAEPICENGFVEFYVGEIKNKVGIERAHIEEDAGKSTHHGDYTLINLNRAGVPLLEIVSRPEIYSPIEAAEYAKAVRRILLYLEVCDGNLEEGSLRCDCNISVRKKGTEKLGTRVEIKNINSFRFVEKALDYEIQRQIDVLESGESLTQETRLYDSTKNSTFSMRVKEEAHDYRYFPDPDLMPARIDKNQIEEIKQLLPELPLARLERFIQQYQLSFDDADFLTNEKLMAEYFESAVNTCGNAKAAANWIMSEMQRELNDKKMDIQNSPVGPLALGELIKLIDSDKITGKIGKQVFQEMWITGKSAQDIVSKLGLQQISDDGEIEKIIDQVIKENPQQVQEFRDGKQKVFGFFVGQIMKVSRGQANPAIVNKILKQKLGDQS